jgi:hypothetical protein
LAERNFRGIINKEFYLSEYCRHGQFFLPSGVVMHRALFNRLGGFNAKLQVAYDWEFLLRASAFAEMTFVDDRPGWSYRIHASQSINRHTAQDNGDSETAFMTLHEWAPFLDEQQRRDIVRGMQDSNENIVSVQIRDKSIAAREVVALRKAIGLKLWRWRNAGLPQSIYVKRYPRSWARILVWLLCMKVPGVAAIRWAILQHDRLNALSRQSCGSPDTRRSANAGLY